MAAAAAAAAAPAANGNGRMAEHVIAVLSKRTDPLSGSSVLLALQAEFHEYGAPLPLSGQ